MTSKKRYMVFDKELRYSVLLGDLYQAELHRHYSMHVIFSLEDSFSFRIDTETVHSAGTVLIGSNIPHSNTEEPECPLFIMSLGPISNLGVYLIQKLKKKKWISLEESWISEVKTAALQLYIGTITQAKFTQEFENNLNANVPNFQDYDMGIYDYRIIEALRNIITNSQEVIPANKVAETLNLSTSRFLHLFKTETGMTYRRMQIWIKLTEAFRHSTNFGNLTELAHHCGFADSAHFSREYKKTFGVSPSLIFRDRK